MRKITDEKGEVIGVRVFVPKHLVAAWILTGWGFFFGDYPSLWYATALLYCMRAWVIVQSCLSELKGYERQ